MSQNNMNKDVKNSKNKTNKESISIVQEVLNNSEGLPKRIKRKQALGKVSDKLRPIIIEYTNGKSEIIGSTYGKSDQIKVAVDVYSHNEFNGKRNEHQVIANDKSSRALRLDFDI